MEYIRRKCAITGSFLWAITPHLVCNPSSTTIITAVKHHLKCVARHFSLTLLKHCKLLRCAQKAWWMMWRVNETATHECCLKRRKGFTYLLWWIKLVLNWRIFTLLKCQEWKSRARHTHTHTHTHTRTHARTHTHIHTHTLLTLRVQIDRSIDRSIDR